MESFDNTVKKSLSFIDFNNDYVKAGISLFLVLYSGLAAPRLPEFIARLFDYTLVKLLIFFMIIYVARQDPTIAIIASVAVLVSLMTLSTYKFNKEMMESIKREEDYEIALRTGSSVPKYTTGSDGQSKGESEGSVSYSDTDYRSFVSDISGLDEGTHLPSIEDAHNVSATTMGKTTGEHQMTLEHELPKSEVGALANDGHLHRLNGSMADGGHSKYESSHDLGYKGHGNENDGYRNMCSGQKNASPLDEDQKVKLVLDKADEHKRKLQRDLTNEELKGICQEVNKKYAVHHYQTDLDSLENCTADQDRDFRNLSGFDNFPREDYGSV
jgi:hypothetical protein